MTDCKSVRRELLSSYEGETPARAWLWTSSFRSYLDALGVSAHAAGRPEIEGWLASPPWGPGPSNRDKRVWAANKLLASARAARPPRARAAGTATARLDVVPNRSPLGKAINRVMASAAAPGDSRRFACVLGVFLSWCDARGVPPEEVWEGDLDVYARDLKAGAVATASGRRHVVKAVGEYRRVAAKLLRELAQSSS
jgi:hypothetical protein